MKTKKILLTKQGYEDLQKEYDNLVNKQRPELVAEIRRSRDLGDLSENGAYHAAKEKQSFLEGRVQELEEMFKNIEVVEKASDGSISTGSVVTLESNGLEVKYMIVGADEANATLQKISHESPLGKELLGKRSGETVKIQAPAGEIEYTIKHVD